MDWILIGTVAGTLITAQFATKESCMGRQATLREQKIEATKCVEMPHNVTGWVTSGSCCTLTIPDPNNTIPVH